MQNPTSVKSSQRVVDVLEHFDAVRRDQRASEIATALGLPVSSCFAVLRTMVGAGILLFDGTTKRYRPTARLRTLTSWIDDEEPLQEQAKCVARRLYRELGTPVAVSRRRGLYVEWLYTIDVAAVQPGQLRPLCRTINGLALLGPLPDHEIEDIVDRHNNDFGRESAVDFKTLLREVQVARTASYASGPTPIDPRLAAICFTLGDEKNAQDLLITVQLPAAELSLRERRVVLSARRLIPELSRRPQHSAPVQH